MEEKKAFLEGKLTAVSLAFMTLVNTPNLLSDISDTARIFAENAEKPITYALFIASVGVVWGGVRRVFGYFKRSK